MLSERATKNVADLFRRAASATLVRTPGDVCNIETTSARDAGVGGLGGRLLMITISSFAFRLVTVFQLGQGEPTRDYYTSGTQSSLDEAFAEVANMCCGALGRELSAQFKHLAMSIPYGLESQCTAFLQDLAPAFRASYDITINSTARLRITLCLCCSRPIEFTAAAVEVNHAGGELEFF
jgi:hypothetical protein